MGWGGSVIPALRRCLGAAVGLVLPEVCNACGCDEVAADGLCETCNVRLLSLVGLPYCPRCGSTLGPNVRCDEGGCGFCPQPLPRFGTVIRLGPYAEPLRSAVRQMKYRRDDSLRRRMAGLLGQAVAARLAERPLDVVLAVPMHWRRRFARGCDHAHTLAEALARRLQLPAGHELVRVRHTPPQVNLPRSRRLANVRGAFAVRSRRSIEGANVLLVDDVTTTGATADEASKTLLEAGAQSVTLAVLAKSEPPRAYADHWAR